MAELDFGRYGHQGRGPDFAVRPAGSPVFAIRRTDRRFGRRAAADPQGPCSRCGIPLGPDGFPMWAFARDGSFAYRFHARCLGFEPVDDELEADEDGAIP